MNFNREPVAWIGIIAAVLIAVAQTLFGQGVITQNVQDSAINLITALVPIISALVARQFVSPVAKPTSTKP